MRCLYCGKEYWLPSQTRRDPDFCTPAHREQYNDRVERAMRLLQESPAPPVLKPLADPLVQKPELRAPSGETHSMAYGTPAATQPSLLSANFAPTPPLRESYEPAPAATAAQPPSAAPGLNFEAPKDDLFTSHVNPAGSPAPATLDRFEEKESASKRDDTEPGFRGMFSLLETAPIDHRRARRLATTAIAASVGGVALLWVGAHAARFGKDLLNLGATVATSSHAAAEGAGTPDIFLVTAPGQRPGSAAFQHPLDWARSAAVRRATTHLAESFETGMTAWGAKPNDWAPGWSRSPDGFVRPGKLALFQPTLRYADYRIDFLGQIENRSLSWVVRGKDTQNYYAMELKLARPGLRPVLSMTHYPVVDGIPGHPVEQPLSVMVHNDTPYHVSVEVEGTHYTVSIEGEKIDSWSDDTLLAGGVGFFSEPGARARIYWLNVSRNDDWFGWFCSRIAGLSDPHENAQLDIPVIPVPVPNPPLAAKRSAPDARTECERMRLPS